MKTELIVPIWQLAYWYFGLNYNIAPVWYVHFDLHSILDWILLASLSFKYKLKCLFDGCHFKTILRSSATAACFDITIVTPNQTLTCQQALAFILLDRSYVTVSLWNKAAFALNGHETN